MIQMNCQGLALGYDSALVRDLNFTVGAGTTCASWGRMEQENLP